MSFFFCTLKKLSLLQFVRMQRKRNNIYQPYAYYGYPVPSGGDGNGTSRCNV